MSAVRRGTGDGLGGRPGGRRGRAAGQRRAGPPALLRQHHEAADPRRRPPPGRARRARPRPAGAGARRPRLGRPRRTVPWSSPARTPTPRPGPRSGATCPCASLVQRMVTVSGNLATNLVLDHVGLAEVAAVLADAGCSERTQVVRGIEDYAARDAGTDNLVTADDLARLMVALAEGRLAGAGSDGRLRADPARADLPRRHPRRAPRRPRRRQQDRLDRRGQPRRRAGPGHRPAAGRHRRARDRTRRPRQREAGIARITASRLGRGARRPTRSTMTR